MAVAVPDAISSAGLQYFWFVKTYADLEAITLAEMSAATTVGAGCYVAANSVDLGFSQGKTEKQRYCLGNAIQSLGKVKFDPPPLRILHDPQGTNVDTNKLAAAMAKGTAGALVFRDGFDKDVAVAAGQKYYALEVSVGESWPAPSEGEDSDFELLVTIAANGDYTRSGVFAAA